MRSRASRHAAGAELRIDSSSVSVWKRGGRLVVLILALIFALIASGVPYVYALAVGVAFEAWRRVHAARWARGRPARVLVDGGAGGKLSIEKDKAHFRIEKSKITDCWQQPEPETGAVRVLAVAPRSQISIQMPDGTSADTLSRALGMDISSRLVGTTLTGPPTFPRQTWLRALRRELRAALEWVLYFVVLLAPSLPAYFGLGTLRTGVVAGAILLPLLLMVWRVLQAAAPSRVYVGRDGLLVTSPKRREFIGYERVRSVRSGVLAVVVTLADGQFVKLPLAVRTFGRLSRKLHPLGEWVGDADQVLARRRTLENRIAEALARYRSAEGDTSAENVARLLDRGSRPIPEWREVLSQIRVDSYRAHHLDAERLVSVVENPRMPIGQRLGAALALASRSAADEAASEPDHDSRVRAAIASSANPKVRIALECAADGKLDEAAYERALEAEAEARRMVGGKRRFNA